MRRMVKPRRRPSQDYLKPPKRLGHPMRWSQRTWRALRSFLTNSFFTSFVAAIVAATITAYVQYEATNQEMRHADEQRQDEERRRRLAIAIMLTNELAAIEGHLTANHASSAPLSLKRLEQWKVSTEPLTKWATDDLFLFDSMFLGHYGTLVTTVNTLETRIDQLAKQFGHDGAAEIPSETVAELKKHVTLGIISSAYLVDHLVKIYRDARVPMGGTFTRSRIPVEPN